MTDNEFERVSLNSRIALIISSVYRKSGRGGAVTKVLCGISTPGDRVPEVEITAEQLRRAELLSQQPRLFREGDSVEVVEFCDRRPDDMPEGTRGIVNADEQRGDVLVEVVPEGKAAARKVPFCFLRLCTPSRYYCERVHDWGIRVKDRDNIVIEVASFKKGEGFDCEAEAARLCRLLNEHDRERRGK